MNPWISEHATAGRPWLIHPGHGENWLKMVADIVVGPNLAAVQVTKTLPMRIEGHTAVIPISGVLLKDVPDWMRLWGLDVTGYGDIRDMLSAALANPGVTDITLAVDSPGGQVAGIMEAAAAIAEANKTKPVTAKVGELSASAAYWLSSQASRIEASPLSEVGSIGVYTVYADFSEMAKAEGVRVIVIRSGEHKGMGVMGAPITEGQIAAVQEVIDGIAAQFQGAVGTGRKMDAERSRK